MRGRSYIFSPSNRHFRAARDLSASKLSLIYAMDCAARQADSAANGDGRVLSVIDARGVGLANLDPDVSKLVVEIAQVRKRKERGIFSCIGLLSKKSSTTKHKNSKTRKNDSGALPRALANDFHLRSTRGLRRDRPTLAPAVSLHFLLCFVFR